MQALPLIERAATLARVARLIQAYPQIFDHQTDSRESMLDAVLSACLECLNTAAGLLAEGAQV